MRHDLAAGILNQLGPESLTHLKKLASNVTSSAAAGGGDDDEEKADKESGNDDDEDDDDDVPDLVGNFDDASKEEGVVVAGMYATLSPSDAHLAFFYRATQQLLDLGWVDFDFVSSIV